MDAKDILGIPNISLPIPQEKTSRPQKDSRRKPDGISREVYALTGGVAPLMPSIDANQLKKRHQPENEKNCREDGLKFPTYNEFVLNCPNITTLALKGFKLHDYKTHMLVKGLQKLKHIDLATSYSFTGSFLKNLSVNGGGDNLEVMILRDWMHLKEIKVERFMEAVLAGEFKHLDISNREGLTCEGDRYNRCYSARLDFYLVAEFLVGRTAGIMGILKKIGRDGTAGITSRRVKSGKSWKMRRTVVAIEGGLYLSYMIFREYLNEAVAEILQKSQQTLFLKDFDGME
ncbi:hypothetical protein Lser_V15G00751 [Lactuca serriola]